MKTPRRRLLVLLTASTVAHGVMFLSVVLKQPIPPTVVSPTVTLTLVQTPIVQEPIVEKEDAQHTPGTTEQFPLEAARSPTTAPSGASAWPAQTAPEAVSETPATESGLDLTLTTAIRNTPGTYDLLNAERRLALIFDQRLREQVVSRSHEQQRQSVLAVSTVERTGLAAEQINSGFSAISRIADTCWAKAAPELHQRGNAVYRVPCPGKKPWWERDGLEEVAAFRGVP